MFVFFLAMLAGSAAAKDAPGNLQLQHYLETHPGDPGILTTSYGYPVTGSEAINGSRRDSILMSAYSYEQLSSFSSERIPPRVVHANGSGAKGTFTVTNDVSSITNAKVFSKVGKKTPIIARFSTSTGHIGSSEVLQRKKGFSVKFYTEEGNMDLIGFNVNAFGIKDPIFAASAIHSFNPNPKTGVPDPTAAWDFIAHNPSGLHAFIQPFSKLGQPKGYRFIPGHALHTYQVENKKGEVSFVKFNWFPDAGIQTFTDAEAATIGATNPDYLTMDLYNAISNETYPSWTLSLQAISEKDVNKAKFDIFDVTLNWPEDQFPNIKIGQFVLDKHVDNHFAEVEQLAFNPANLPPGIRGVDNIFFARTLAYRDGQIHRMSRNFNNIPVNCPRKHALTFNRDGSPPVLDNGGDTPNYYPSSFNPLVPANRKQAPLYRPNIDSGTTNLWQVASYYKGLSKDDQQALVNNLGQNLATIPSSVYKKVYAIFKEADKDFAGKIQTVVKKQNESSSKKHNEADKDFAAESQTVVKNNNKSSSSKHNEADKHSAAETQTVVKKNNKSSSSKHNEADKRSAAETQTVVKKPNKSSSSKHNKQ